MNHSTSIEFASGTESTPLRLWLQNYLPVFDELQIVTDHPWAQVYRIICGDEEYFLKTVPLSQRSSLKAIEVMSRLVGPSVPNIVACDPDNGWTLQRHHGGSNLRSSASEEQLHKILECYARLQAMIAESNEVVQALPRLSPSTLVTDFLEFLDPNSLRNHRVGLSHFVGDQDADEFHKRIALKSKMFQELIEQSERLRPTINHCDLRPKNAAQRSDGSIVLFDWDEAVAGPAGLSLHNFFSGCSIPLEILRERSLFADESHPRLMQTYLETLVSSGYASRSDLTIAIPGAVCAGVMRYIMSYGAFPMTDAEDRETVAKILRRRLMDLIEVPSILALNDRQKVYQEIDAYEKSGFVDRQDALLYRYLQHHPEDADRQCQYARLQYDHDEFDEAFATCVKAIRHAPLHAGLRAMMGKIQTDRLELDQAIDHFRIATYQSPENLSFLRDLEEAQRLVEMKRVADEPAGIPSIRFSVEELSNQTISRGKLRLASRFFQKHGVLLIENALSPELVSGLAQSFFDRYREELRDQDPKGALRVGDRRFMMTVTVSDAFNNPELYAPKLIFPILSKLLGPDFVLGSFCSVASFPGARDMDMHKDHPALFPDWDNDRPLPHFAITMLVPLLGYNSILGTTRVVKGSHTRSSKESQRMEYQDPIAEPGSCLLMDYRLSHQGLANRSDQIRPVLSLVYNRPWFRDYVNYKEQLPLEISTDELRRVPEDFTRLFISR
ncbi:MAG: phytanoyl-CoA dioxygenase family protein [Pirellula sp.]|jgi:hypothetical protein